MFQFTHPGRGATSSQWIACDTSLGFNSRTPGGVRRVSSLRRRALLGFNSRTPGGVRQFLCPPRELLLLVSIHAPREGCDSHWWYAQHANHDVSIHAPREGCDVLAFPAATIAVGFNSRTPGGVRLPKRSYDQADPKFQFTHPGRGATIPDASQRSFCSRFNSRTPGGVRPKGGGRSKVASEFQFTHPGRGATQ